MKEKIISQFSELNNKLARQPLVVVMVLGLLPASILFYLGYSFLIADTREDNEKRLTAVKAKETQNESGRAIEDQMPAFKAEFGRIVGLVEQTEPLLPKETELFAIMAGIQQAANERNVTLTGFNANKPAGKSPNADKLYEKEIPAQVTGNYDDVLKFFDDISNLQRIMVIRDFDSASAKLRGASGARPDKVSVAFNLLAFHSPPSSEFPTIPSDVQVQRREMATR
jgi:Tfp pilus assembly protein PilO